MTRLYIGSKLQSIEHISHDYPSYQIIQSYDCENTISKINVFFDHNKIYFHVNPKNDELKLIDSQKLSESIKHFIFFDDESFDGRNSLIQKIKKNNNIYNFIFPTYGDFSQLEKSIIDYLKNFNLKIERDCLIWLREKCPILKIKSKTNKKENIHYDLDLLYREIDKFRNIKNTICISDFENSNFNQDSDIFLLFEYIFKKDKVNILETWEKLISNNEAQSIIIIFVHQLIFLLQLCGLKQLNNFDMILQKLELKDLLGKYFDSDWESISSVSKSHNPLRVKIELSKSVYNLNFLSELFYISIETLLNLRSNLNKDLTLFSFINRITNV